MLEFITYWGLHFSVISLITSYFAAKENHIYYHRRIAIITMELSLIINIITAFLYWFVVYDEMTVKYKWDEPKGRKILIHLSFLHLIPLATTLINFLISNVAFVEGDWKYQFYVIFLYGVINYLITEITGKAVYSLLPWENYKSPMLILIFLIFGVFLHIMLTKLSHIIKKGTSPDMEERLLDQRE